MLILGISGLSRQATAAIVRDGEILAACEEAKLMGRGNPEGVPHNAIGFCLKRAGATAADVEAVALDLHPFRPTPARGGKLAVSSLDSVLQAVASARKPLRSRRELRHLRTLQEAFPRADLFSVQHAAALAAFAYYPSSFDRAMVLTLDSGRLSQSGAVAVADRERIRTLAVNNQPPSLGLLYGEVSELLGWDPTEEVHRMVWLSTTGEPEFASVFRHILAPLRKGQLRLSGEWFTTGVLGRIRPNEKFLDSIGLDGSAAQAAKMPETWRANLAASLQSETEDALVEFAEHWRKKTRATHLCFGGGVAFNALLVNALATRTGFRDGFIPPAAGEAGCAAGAAMAASQHNGVSVTGPLLSASLGPAYSGQEIKDVLDNCRLRYRHMAMPQLIQEVAQLLAQGAFVGWFQGGAEFGPRALGNRSILAAPRDNWVKENLNAYTKRRERFRPLAASVTEEQAARYFEYRWPAAAAFLATVARVKDPASIPGLAFAGDRARIHVVSRSANRHYHELLTRVGQITGHPILINTSFNEPGAPLAATPNEALRVFFSSGVDVLAIGNFLLQK